MTEKPPSKTPPEREPVDPERVSIPLDPEEALRALLKVDPDSEPRTLAGDRRAEFERELAEAQRKTDQPPDK